MLLLTLHARLAEKDHLTYGAWPGAPAAWRMARTGIPLKVRPISAKIIT